MTQTAQRTPTPWIVWQLAPDSDPEQRTIITTEDGETEVTGIIASPVDAAFIVRACNSYGELLEALDQAESELERMEGATGHHATDSVIVGVRRAIAKAKAPA